MVRYILTDRVRKNLESRGYKLVCKICDKKLEVGQEIESKPSKYKRRKFYHKSCYENSFIDLGDDDGDSEDS